MERKHGLKRGNACFTTEPADSFATEETFVHNARRKRIRVGTQAVPIAEMWKNSAQANAEGQALQLDFVNYANQIQAALYTMFHEMFHAVNKVQNVIFKISSSTGRAVKHTKRVYWHDPTDVEMTEV